MLYKVSELNDRKTLYPLICRAFCYKNTVRKLLTEKKKENDDRKEHIFRRIKCSFLINRFWKAQNKERTSTENAVTVC